jgi:hypothetical protein
MKLAKLACVAAVVMALTSASVWEGAAAVASGGELPQAGYYAATNSFPRNTVVDITNLENGKSIRVIVAAGLETPGLLAVLSASAAELIGLRSGFIGRIRMSQPSDPIAFSRFTEGMAAYGEPDYTAGIPITPEAAYAPPPAPNPAPFIGGRETTPHPDAGVPVPDVSVSGGESGSGGVPAGASLPAYVPEPEWEEFSYGTVVDLPETAPVESRVEAPVPVEAPATPLPEYGSELYDFSLVPAEERPPEGSAADLIAPEDIIPGIGAPGGRPDHTPLAELPAEDWEEEPSLPPSADYGPFPVPLISTLERGKYYVQIGAFNRPELIDSAVSRIGANYPLTVQNAGSEREPLYRILLGPLNLGESGAMLQRVKSIGYKDAFVRGN